jgi:rhodanese-related sulfurtransferase
MHRSTLPSLLAILAALRIVPCIHAADPDAGFVTLFDGASLKGWHISAKTGHSAASGHKTGGRWVVEGGAIVGSQDIPGNGGIIITDETFGDFEVAVEMKNDFGPDSGLFLRSTEDGKAWQAMIDYHAGGNLMGVYGEGLGGQPSVRNFSFENAVTQIKVQDAPVAFPMAAEKWPEFWKHGQWNELRARIVNNPPTITTWINGVKFMEWTEKEVRHPAQGAIALQVHGGGDTTKEFVRYRNIRVKKLPPPAPFKTIDVKAFESLRGKPDVVVLDVRTAREFAEGHVPGAVNMDVSAAGFAEKAGKLDREKTYLVMCRAGGRSLTACQKMAPLNFSKLYNLEGGFMAWEDEGNQPAK